MTGKKQCNPVQTEVHLFAKCFNLMPCFLAESGSM